MVESLAPWQDDANWQPPALPRFGPPLPSETKPEAGSDQQQRERSDLSEDEFLR
jgi:hypothetical protein